MSDFEQFFVEHRILLWTIVVATVSNVACAVLGCYLVLRRMSMMGDAISHAVLPGIVIVFVIAGTRDPLAMLVGAAAMGLLTALGTQALHAGANVPEDSSMGVVFTSLFALGIVLVTTLARQIDLDPGCVLYGFLEAAAVDRTVFLGVEVPAELGVLVPACLLSIGFVVLFWKELKIAAFDGELASAMGYSANLMHYLLMALVAVVTVASFRVVGSVIVVAMLIVPAATAYLLTDRLSTMMLLSALLAASASTLGALVDSVFVTTASGMIALVAGAQLGLAIVFSPKHGLVVKLAHRAGLTLRIVGEDIVATIFRAEETSGAGLPVGMSRQQCLAGRDRSWINWLALPWLVRRGALQLSQGHYQLTDAGRNLARSLVRSHRLWEAYLTENFQLPLDHLHAPAERVEHFIGPELQQQLAAEVQAADVDPHGRVIPDAPPPPPT